MLSHTVRLLITTALAAPLLQAPAAAQTSPIVDTPRSPEAGQSRSVEAAQADGQPSEEATNAPPQENAATPGSSPDQATAGGNAIGDVIVTAQRVESSAQRTPISIQVYSGETLAARGIADLRQLANIDPSIGINSAGGQTTIAVRGIASSNVTETGEPAVSVSVDGAFNNRGYSLGATLYDVGRIEILRGPQGTLFGRNTTGGLLNIVTQRPNQELGGRVTVDLGNYDARFVDGFLNLPLADELAVRGSFAVRRRDGIRGLTPSGERGSNERTEAGRLQLLWRPADGLEFWLLGSYTKEGGLGSVAETIPFRYRAGTPLNPVTGAPPPGTEPLHTIPPLSDGFDYPIYTESSLNVRTAEVKGGVTLELDAVTLSYFGSYSDINYRASIPTIFRRVPSVFTRRESPVTYNNEIRLSSNGDGPLVWQVGAFAFDERSSLFTDLVRNPDNAAATQLYLFDSPEVDAKSRAVFGQGTYGVTEQLKFTTGLRYTDDAKLRRGGFFLRPAFTGAPVTIRSSQDGRSASDKITWLLGVDYEATPQNLIYAKVSTGYKAGGFTGVSQYEPENVRSYELGTKNRFLDGRLQLNLAAFYSDFTDQQINQYIAVNGVSQAVTTNAGESRIYGVEANLSAIIDPIGRFDIAANYLNARYRQFLFGAGWSSPPGTVVVLDLSGNRLPVSPDFAASVQYEKKIANVLGGALTARAALKYQTTVYFGPENFPNQRQGGYALTDANFTYELPGRNFSVQGYVNNIFDVDRFASSVETYPFNTYSFLYGLPRTYGVRLTAGF